MAYQMTLDDMICAVADVSVKELDYRYMGADEIARVIGRELGVNFKATDSEYRAEYRATGHKALILYIEVNETLECISASAEYGLGGCSFTCYSIERVLEVLRGVIRRYEISDCIV